MNYLLKVNFTLTYTIRNLNYKRILSSFFDMKYVVCYNTNPGDFMDNIPNNKFYTTAVSSIRNIAVTNAKLQMISEENENSSTISLMCKMPCCRINNKICSYQELIMMYYQAIDYDCCDVLAHLNEVSHTLFVDALALDAKYNELFRR